MKAYEFPARLTPEGKITLPDSLIKLLPEDQIVKVMIFISEPTDPEEQGAWSRLTKEQFITGYSEADAIYDRA